MKTIIAGGRTVTNYAIVEDAIKASGFTITEVVSGACRGVDRMGEQWADSNGIGAEQFPAEWEKYGKRAGPKRNAEMAIYADALIAIWDGKSRGTKNMIDHAKHYGLKVFVWRLDRETQTSLTGIHQ